MYYCIQDSHSSMAWDRDLRCVACYAFGELALSQSWFCILRIDILNRNVNVLSYFSFCGNFLTCQDQCAGSDEVLNSLPNGMLPNNTRTINKNCFKLNYNFKKFHTHLIRFDFEMNVLVIIQNSIIGEGCTTTWMWTSKRLFIAVMNQFVSLHLMRVNHHRTLITKKRIILMIAQKHNEKRLNTK